MAVNGQPVRSFDQANRRWDTTPATTFPVWRSGQQLTVRITEQASSGRGPILKP